MNRAFASVVALRLTASVLAQTTTIHTVSVGANGHNFTPNTTYAAAGDIIVFDFYPTNHSVIRGEYSNNTSLCGLAGCNPCVPWELYHVEEADRGFFSGNHIINTFTQRQTWNLTINNTDPIWFYCDALESCSPNGMVGVINPQNGSSFLHQHTQAVNSEYQLAPGQSWPAEGGSSSSSASSSSNHHSSLSGGAIAGIVIGAVAFVAMAAALMFYIGRNRVYGKFLNGTHGHASQPPTSEVGDHAGSQAGGSLPPGAWSDHTPSRIGSPPVGYSDKGTPPLGRWSGSSAFTNMQPQQQQQYYEQYSSPPPQGNMLFVGYNRQTGAPEFTPELPGDQEINQASVVPPVEMDGQEQARMDKTPR